MDLLILNTKILSFNKPTSEFEVYCFAHNISCLPLIVQTLINKSIKKIHILGNNEIISGVSVFEVNKAFYEENGITVIEIPYQEKIIHTKIESDFILSWFIKKGVNKLVIISPLFHILRSTMTIISSVIDNNYKINIIPISNNIDDWDKKFITHQGKNKNTIWNLINDEFERIKKYQIKGDIKDESVILKYLKSIK